MILIGNYYPFGLTFNSYRRENSVPNQYLYNGKELQDELDLGWLDYGTRMYMPEVGRWSAIDPLGEKYLQFSTYVYVSNNPLLLIDPNGAEIWLSFSYEDEDGNRITKKYQYKNNTLVDKDGNEYEANDENSAFTAVLGQLNSIKSLLGENEEINKMFSFLEGESSDEQLINIDPNAKINNNEITLGRGIVTDFINRVFRDETTTTYNPFNWKDPEGERRDPRIGLLHELRHAADKAGMFTDELAEVGARNADSYEYEGNKLQVLECRSVNTENLLRAALGMDSRKTYRNKDGILLVVPQRFLTNTNKKE